MWIRLFFIFIFPNHVLFDVEDLGRSLECDVPKKIKKETMGLGSIAWQTCLRPPPCPDNQGLIIQMQGVPYTPSLRRYSWSGTARSGHPYVSCTQNGLFRAWSAGSIDSYHRSSSDLIRPMNILLYRPDQTPLSHRSLCSSDPFLAVHRPFFSSFSAFGTNRQAIEQSIDRAKVAREGRVAEEMRREVERCLLFNKNTRSHSKKMYIVFLFTSM